MIEGVSHIGLVVSDLDHTAHLLTRIFDAEEILPHDADSSSAAKDRFFRIAGLWVVLTEGSSHPDRTHDHVAFKIPREDLEEYRSRIRSLGLEFSEGHSRVPGQSISLYFHDDDNHLFELQTGTLEQRLGIDR